MQNLPQSTFFSGRDAATTSAPQTQARAAAELAADPFAPSPHVRALIDANALLAPLVVVWNYRVPDAAIFSGWLSTKEMLIKPGRLAGDPRLTGVRYGGTFQVHARETGDNGAAPPAQFRTHWGYADEDAMAAMHALCSGDYERATIAQIDLMEFVQGVKGFVSAAGDEHFQQDVLSASAVLLPGHA